MATLRFSWIGIFASCLAVFSVSPAAEPLVELKPKDHVAIVGSGLADRQQHHAWFEAMIHQAYPTANLTIRNLGFAADEITVQRRSDDVPTTDWFLGMKKGDTTKPDNNGIVYKAGTEFGADVIFAYWGFNESFKGPEGVEAFKRDLDAYLGKLLAAKYNGESAPRVVLFSPIAHENLKSPHFSDGSENNRNLSLYTEAMAAVAKAKNVPFVDLFRPSQELYQQATKPLTINGVHLNESGDKALAAVQYRAVFGKEPPTANAAQLEKIRAGVIDKNTEWHHRYRTVDQYNIFGGRSRIAYEGVTNATILGEELAQRDVKTANRDQLVWATAQGKSYIVKDDNLPPVNLTPPNRKDAVPYMDPQEAIQHLKLAPGCKVELVACEKTFPDLINPVQMNFDTKGRLWIAAWPNYPETTPTTKVFDKLVVFDLDPKTGKAIKSTVFADGLNCPTGFQFYKDGVLVMQSPDLWFLRDTDGDGKADTKERMLHGLDAADSHHETNSMCLEPGGAVYLSDGVFHRTNVETYLGPVRNTDGAIYRYEPNTGKFMRHVPYGFANPHGRVFDYWGNDLITDATGNSNYFGPAFSGHLDSGSHPGMKEFWNRPSRPCPGTAILTSRHFPDDWQGLFLNTNVISIQGIFRAKMSEEGSGVKGETLEHLITTDIAKNPNFRPSGITVAPDGSLYFMDWSQMLIGHLQHHLRDPNRDHQHGRLYRITYEGRPLLEPKKIDGQPIPALLELLKEPENDVRMRAKIELDKHNGKKVTDAVMEWIKVLDAKDHKFEHNMLEALWVHQWHDIVNEALLTRMLKSPEPRARAQAVRVMGYWRDRLPDSVKWLKTAADDEHPRVRLEAVRVASFYRETAAADAALTALKHPMDYYIEYCFKETMRQLQPWWKNAVAEGKEIAVDNPAGVSYLLDSVRSADLGKLPKSTVVFTAMLTRPDVAADQRQAALTELSALKKTTPAQTLLSVLEPIASESHSGTQALGQMLLGLPAADLQSVRPALEKLAAGPSSRAIAPQALAALMICDGTVEKQWTLAQQTPAALQQFLAAVPLLPESLRHSAFGPIKSVLSALPPTIAKALENQNGTRGRFIRIELPRNGTLSLAEVQVMSEGKNIALSGKASQINTSNDGEAKRAIDGNTNGAYNSGTITHSIENTNKPWWEVDLGADASIEEVIVWNRDEESLGSRLQGYTISVLDAQRGVIAALTDQPAPAPSSSHKFAGDPIGGIRREAIRALPKVSADAAQAFALLTDLIQKQTEPATAVQTIAQLPAASWKKELAATAVSGIVQWARTQTSEARTSKSYLDSIAVTQKLIALLPADQAATAQKAIADLDVPVFLIKAVKDQLRYDVKQIVVAAGKDFEVRFENPDLIPHNVVFVQPGTLQAVAEAVQTQAPDKLDPQGRAYVPANDNRVLAATKMIEAGKSETIKITAPTTEGTYQFVCTFPGHWSVMRGELIVTKDVEAYRKAHPEAGK